MRAAIALLLILLAGALPALGQGSFSDRFFSICPDTDPTPVFEFQLLQPATVTLRLADTYSGQTIRTLVEGVLAAGMHSVVWDGRDDDSVMLDVQPVEVLLTVDGEPADSFTFSVMCGNDLGTPTREKAGEKDVTLGFWFAMDEQTEVLLAIWDETGTTLIDTLYSGLSHSMTGTIWPPNQARGGPVPAGDYLCRLSSSVYSEDLSFHLDPVATAGMTVFVSDGDGNLVQGVEASAGFAQVYGPLQEAWVQFDRALSAPELEYLLGGGLRFNLPFWLEPDAITVTPDSSTIHIGGFVAPLTWTETLGHGYVANLGMTIPQENAFRIGHHFTGLQTKSPDCLTMNLTDPDDWQTDELHNVEPPCPNPIAPEGSTSIWIGSYYMEYTVVRIWDAYGNQVRSLFWDEFDGGTTLTWDLTDDEGVPVPGGYYHLNWTTPDPDSEVWRVVTSGDILISAATGIDDEVPLALARPRLEPNWPNPFNPRTTIAFTLPTGGPVSLSVFDLSGRRVRELIAGETLEAGRHETVWFGRDDQGRALASGTYLYRLRVGEDVQTRRAVLLK